jgi:cell division protein FtsB
MNAYREKVIFSVAILLMFSILLFILMGDKGLMDFNQLSQEKELLIQKNENLNQQNLIMYRQIERLKKDPAYIESVARKEYGMVGKDEIVVKLNPEGDSSP